MLPSVFSSAEIEPFLPSAATRARLERGFVGGARRSAASSLRFKCGEIGPAFLARSLRPEAARAFPLLPARRRSANRRQQALGRAACTALFAPPASGVRPLGEPAASLGLLDDRGERRRLGNGESDSTLRSISIPACRGRR